MRSPLRLWASCLLLTRRLVWTRCPDTEVEHKPCQTPCLDLRSMYVTRRRPSKGTRERIMSVVTELLEEGTFHESTVEEVASRAGVSRATLYQHFGSRLGLVDALCETFATNPSLIALRTVDDLDELIARVVEFWASEEKVLAPLYGAAAVDSAAYSLVERQRRDRHAELRRVLRVAGADNRPAFAL